MKVGKMDGFCVGEPWNARAIADGIGFTAITTQDDLEGPPREGLRVHRGVRGEESEDGQGGAQGAARGQRLARRHGEPPRAGEHRLAADLHQLPARRSSSAGCRASTTTATAARKQDPNYMIFSERNCNYPQPKYAVWWLTQFRRWGMVAGHAGLRGRRQAGDAHRPLRRGDEGDRLRRTAARTTSRRRCSTASTFDPAKPEEYATSFAVHSMKG